MSPRLDHLRGLLTGEHGASRVVPPSGVTAWLTLFAAGAMAFLAVFALALSLASSRLADRWDDALAQSSTLRISAPEEEMTARTDRALEMLRATPGIKSARALDTNEQRALLAPWFGPDLPLETLPIPQLIEIIEQGEGYDAAGLRQRLSAEVPGAVLDDHTRWRAPLIKAASRLCLLGWMSLALIAGTIAAMVTLAANAALAANAQVIGVLRLVGARDGYIAQAFVRRFILCALGGAAIGTVLGIGAVLLLPDADVGSGFLTGLGFRGWHWVLPLTIPLLSGGLAYLTTRAAALRTLRAMP